MPKKVRWEKDHVVSIQEFEIKWIRHLVLRPQVTDIFSRHLRVFLRKGLDNAHKMGYIEYAGFHRVHSIYIL